MLSHSIDFGFLNFLEEPFDCPIFLDHYIPPNYTDSIHKSVVEDV